MGQSVGYSGYTAALKLPAKEALPLKTLSIGRTGRLEVERSFQVKNIKVFSDVLGYIGVPPTRWQNPTAREASK